jgi:hypothetical protein
MLRPITVIAGAVALVFVFSPAEAHKNKTKNVPWPCGDYDGVPSHNDCWPVSDKKQEDCQVWIDAGNGTDDQKRKDKYRIKYFKCVDWPGDYETTMSPRPDQGEPEEEETEEAPDGAPMDEAPGDEAPADEAPPEL